MGVANEEGATHESVSTARGRPAVGAIVTEENQPNVARLVLRASHEGYPVVLTYDGLRPKQIEFFQREDVVLAHPDDPSPTRDELVETLARTAEERGFPGLVSVVFHQMNARLRKVVDGNSTERRLQR